MEKTLIIIPAYNVASELSLLLPKLIKYRNNCLIVDDGSTDETNIVINQKEFNSIRMPHNFGVSCAINAGIDYAMKNGYKSIVLMDADGQHNPEDIGIFLEALTNYDMVFANRFTANEFIPTCKIVSNAFASMLYNDISGNYIPDIACGYKAFKITGELYDYLQSSEGYSIIYRLVNYAIFNKIPICFVPTQAIYYNNELLFTRTCELKSLFSSVLELGKIFSTSKEMQRKIDYVLKSIAFERDFEIVLCETEFFAFFIKQYEGYIIQSSLKEVYSYYEKRRRF